MATVGARSRPAASRARVPAPLAGSTSSKAKGDRAAQAARLSSSRQNRRRGVPVRRARGPASHAPRPMPPMKIARTMAIPALSLPTRRASRRIQTVS